MSQLSAIPIFKSADNQIAEAYRKFDHWQRHEHGDCQHDSILECIEEYARPWTEPIRRAAWGRRAGLEDRRLRLRGELLRAMVRELAPDGYRIGGWRDDRTDRIELIPLDPK